MNPYVHITDENQTEHVRHEHTYVKQWRRHDICQGIRRGRVSGTNAHAFRANVRDDVFVVELPVKKTT
jgi:hypothetical protein